MGTLLPTDKIIDERVVREFYKVMNREAQRQNFHPSIFPIIGDVSLGEMMDEMRAGTYQGLDYYRRAIHWTTFSIPKEKIYIDNVINPQVAQSYQQWLADISEDRYYRRSTKQVVDELCRRETADAQSWKRAYQLTRQRERLNSAEMAELVKLESTLDGNKFTQLRDEMKPQILHEQMQRVHNEYIIPGTSASFAMAFAQIKQGSGEHFYQRMIDIHAGFEYRKAA